MTNAEALKYCKRNRYQGLVSGKKHRQGRADKIWKGIVSSSDQYYEYANIKDIGIKIKEI